MKQLKKIDDFFINEINEEAKSKVIAGRAEDSVSGCVEYTQINSGVGDMNQVMQKDDGTPISDVTVYYPTWPL